MRDTISINQKLVLYKRKLILMGTTTDKEKISIKERLNNWHKVHTFMSSVLASITASAILGVIGYIFAIRTVENLTISIDNKIDEKINIAIGNIYQDNDDNIDNSNNDGAIKNGDGNTIYNIEGDAIFYNKNELNTDFENDFQSMFNNDAEVFSLSENHQFDENYIIATDSETGKLVTVADLYNQTFCFNYYTENGEDVFFKGQFDENGYWDGNCIVNRYLDGKLTFIMDAVYNSGELRSYKKVFSYVNRAGVGIWAISERDINKEKNAGETWTYLKEGEYESNLTSESITEKDILNVDNFVKNSSLILDGFYSGYTSDGYYNDTTGNAYLVQYNEYGYVRYLYVGKVVDGYPHDDTGNAWCISLGYDNEHYYYYKGKFKNEEDANGKQERKTLDEINSIIAPYNFKCEIKWKGTEDI